MASTFQSDGKGNIGPLVLAALQRTTLLTTSRTATLLRTAELTQSQFAVLEALFLRGPGAQRGLADSLLVSAGTITFVVDKLEQRGLVKRVPSLEDRRVIQVHLTRAGEKLVASVLPSYQALIVDLFDGLSLSEQKELLRLCKKLESLAQNT